MTQEVIIDAREISRVFTPANAPAVHAVRDVNLQVLRGEFLLINGASGSGKTTLLSMMGCLLSPTRGSLTVLGHNVGSASRNTLEGLRLRRVGFIFQAFRLLDGLSVLENVELPLLLNRSTRRASRDRACMLLERLKMTQRLSFRPSSLSGGERQRVAIARALANDPDVILADEPTGNLDSRTGLEVIELLRLHTVSAGKSVILVSHDTRLHGFADRILCMEDGQIRG